MSRSPVDGGRSVSYWAEHERVPSFAPLAGDVEADVCVIGGGVAGLSVAYELACDGRRVVVLEDGEIGAGETGRTTAHLSNAFDDSYVALEGIVGVDRARVVAASHTWAIDRIEAIVRAEGIDCDFQRVDGFLSLAAGDDPRRLREELAASHRAGLTDVAWVDAVPLLAHGVARGQPALRYPAQGQVFPLRYLAGLAAAVARRGGRIHTHTRATHVGGGRVATANGAEVRCAATVLATFAPSADDAGPAHPRFSTWQPAYRTYVVAAAVPAGALPFAQLWDTCEAYHYVRLHRPRDDGRGGAATDVLMVGGEDHKSGQGGADADAYAARYERLERWMRAHFSMAGPVIARWSGQLMEPVDHLASIGPHPGFAPDDRVYVVTGDSGHGITHAAIAGRLLTALIAGRDDAWAAPYDPARLTRLPHDRAVLAALVRENANALAARLAGDLASHDASLAALPPGSGTVVRRTTAAGDDEAVAAYRDPGGAVHLRRARCPHRGCTVGWNPAESTWDCPCHGSRFDPLGTVLDGPAGRDLDRL